MVISNQSQTLDASSVMSRINLEGYVFRMNKIETESKAKKGRKREEILPTQGDRARRDCYELLSKRHREH